MKKKFNANILKNLISKLCKLNKEDKIRLIIRIISGIIFICCFAFLANYYYGLHKSQKDFEALANLVEEEEVTSTDTADTVENNTNEESIEQPSNVTTGENITPTVLKKYKKLYKKNSDMVGYIKIDGILEYPIMQSKKDKGEYYIHRNFFKETSKPGTPFLNINCSITKPTMNFIIYGHNMQDTSMFGKLKFYQDEGYYKYHRIIQFDTIYETGTYEIVAVFQSKYFTNNENVFKYYKYTDFKDKKTYDYFIKKIKKMSFYDTGVTSEYGDQLITLSTCDHYVKNGRFVVVARKITDGQTKTDKDVEEDPIDPDDIKVKETEVTEETEETKEDKAESKKKKTIIDKSKEETDQTEESSKDSRTETDQSEDKATESSEDNNTEETKENTTTQETATETKETQESDIGLDATSFNGEDTPADGDIKVIDGVTYIYDSSLQKWIEKIIE